MTERAAADAFLSSTLNGSSGLLAIATGGVYPDQAPDGVDAFGSPYVVFSCATSRDEYANDRLRVFTEMEYTVRAVCGDNSSIPDQIDAILDPLLSNETGGELKVQQNGYQIDCMRTRPLSTLSTSNPGRTYRYAGGWYRITVRKLI